MQGYRQGGSNPEREAGNEASGNNQAIDKIVYGIAHQNKIRERLYIGGCAVLVTPVEKLLQHEED